MIFCINYQRVRQASSNVENYEKSLLSADWGGHLDKLSVYVQLISYVD